MQNDNDNMIELLALNVECQGMVAENKQRELLGQSPAYHYDSFAIVAGKMRQLKSAAPTTSDGPENSVQQLYGKMPKSCYGCPITSTCVIARYNGLACQDIWRGLFRYFAV